jgi:CHASE2 domain-containing sensor protein
MSKRAVIRLDGNLEQGFNVTLEVGEENKVHSIEDVGILPPSPELIQSLQEWRYHYRKLSGSSTRITLQKVTVQTGSLSQTANCSNLAKELRHYFRVWLASGTFHIIDSRIRDIVSRKDLVRVVLRTQDKRLHLLPWHFWDFIERYPKSEIALSAPVLQLGKVKNLIKPRKKVRILAILGHREGINTEADRKILENNLPNTEVVFLVEPARQDINEQLWNQHWDILFFAGHSQTDEDETGKIHINERDSLTIEDLKYGLRQAISQGLQLAIFNSCDGLGLAYELEQLSIPQLIVMREPVPDEVAQEFLKHLLTGFAEGKRFYLAVRDAREKLQGLEDKFPCASWLPIIFQNPAQPPLTWKDLRYRDVQSRDEQEDSIADIELDSDEVESWGQKFRKNLRLAVLTGSLVTGLVMGLRLSGNLQPVELWAYDLLMRSRPLTEKPDDRILLVTVDEEDLKYQNQQGMQIQQGTSLSDEALNQLLKKLEPYKPAVIGLDIIRDRKVSPEDSELKARLQKIIPACLIGGGRKNNPEIEPPPEVASEQIGFANSSIDPDDVIRRHVIGMSPGKKCNTDKSLSFQISSRYLERVLSQAQLKEENLYFGNRPFSEIKIHTGAYNQPVLGGYEVMLNYRASSKVAEQVSLSQILNGSKDNELTGLVEDRIILIGTIARTYNDYSYTPYGEMSGVVIQAHKVSQILNAILENRTLIWTFPQVGDGTLIWIWSLVGATVALQIKSKLHLLLLSSGILLTLYATYYFMLLAGGWMPLVPSLLAFTATTYATSAVKSKIKIVITDGKGISKFYI